MTSTAGDIQDEMSHVRREIRDDVRGIFAGARAMTDWRHYLRQYPWVAVGAAAVVGFWVVPARTVFFDNSLIDLANTARKHKAPVDPALPQQKSDGVLGSLAGLAVSSLLQSAVAIGASQLNQFLHGRISSQPLSQGAARNDANGFAVSTPALACSTA